MKKRSIIIEGVDRIGKDTLITNLMNELGFFTELHFEKPRDLKYFSSCPIPTLSFQQRLFWNAFSILATNACYMQSDSVSKMMPKLRTNSNVSKLEDYRTPEPFILNRFHLGEYVYSPMYRGYNGDYVFDLELEPRFDMAIQNSVLILLVTDSFSFIEDDGKSFNFENAKLEQDKFIEAFNKSNFVNKKIINVSRKKTVFGKEKFSFVDPKEITKEVINFLSSLEG
jgi:hypothetical protein